MVLKGLKWFAYFIAFCLVFALVTRGIDRIFGTNLSGQKQHVAEQTETTEPTQKAPAAKEETTEVAEPTPEEIQAAQQKKAAEEQRHHAETDGMDAIQEYGEINYFPYGWNLHDIWGVINVEPMGDGTWFVKAECDYENEYGNKIDGVCEAYITGSDENWTVQQFTVY